MRSHGESPISTAGRDESEGLGWGEGIREMVLGIRVLKHGKWEGGVKAVQ